VQKITLLPADHPFPPHAERWLAGWLIHRRGFDFGGCPVSYSPKLFQRRMTSLANCGSCLPIRFSPTKRCCHKAGVTAKSVQPDLTWAHIIRGSRRTSGRLTTLSPEASIPMFGI
jgi:hypothetical protein